MDSVLLALIADLYSQIGNLKAENAQLRAALKASDKGQ